MTRNRINCASLLVSRVLSRVFRAAYTDVLDSNSFGFQRHSLAGSTSVCRDQESCFRSVVVHVDRLLSILYWFCTASTSHDRRCEVNLYLTTRIRSSPVRQAVHSRLLVNNSAAFSRSALRTNLVSEVDDVSREGKNLHPIKPSLCHILPHRKKKRRNVKTRKRSTPLVRPRI